ncbi:rRNA pseudouridine synthase [Fictibacillus sp. KIGAM418]|uniref:Pseudouridine synthase n=1 Tax=Fictibacillus marinisediminis TaxID=2878389 RepID=A0A9X2BDQ5_9BACL|nr:pseudouridine synthase [Fictibacillus marinisediminis]MCK6258114.1 rRNA pseudouridine synthase [Fictibacillus marinisediminis]
MRIDKLLANMGFGTRKEVKQLLKKGAVLVDGIPVKDSKTKVNPEMQKVTVHGEEVVFKDTIYLMMNKPPGVISATEDHVQETVIDLLEEQDQILSPFPVGRLDKDTEGLLILTNDGQLSHSLLSPKKHVPKTYYAKIEGVVTQEDVDAFNDGVTLEDGYKTKPGALSILHSGEVSEIELIITEGKFHQVKRMFEAVGKKVTYLKRIQMGGLKLDEKLKLGEYRELTAEELERLLEREVF